METEFHVGLWRVPGLLVSRLVQGMWRNFEEIFFAVVDVCFKLRALELHSGFQTRDSSSHVKVRLYPVLWF